MKRLLHVFPAFGEGGPEVRTADIINQSSDRFDHHVLSLSANTTGRRRLTNERAVASASRAESSLWGLAKTIRSYRPDLLLTYGWGGTDAIASARLAGIRRIVHAEDGFLDDEVDRQHWKRRWARRVVFQAAQSLVVPSLTLCNIARSSWRIANGRLRYIPNGVDVERFQPPSSQKQIAARRSVGLPDDAVVVGIVGALRPEKNQSRLLQAFATLCQAASNVWLVVVGDGPERTALDELAKRTRVTSRVILAGSIRDTTVHYNAMSLLAISSDTEQMPLSVLEGMASGLPILSTDVGDVKSMICEDNRPFVFSCSDLPAYTHGLSTLIADCRLRAALGAANRQKCVEVFAARKMLSTYIDLYDEFSVAS
jgi:glycosyltransferase involved in cell wall biosynthesis